MCVIVLHFCVGCKKKKKKLQGEAIGKAHDIVYSQLPHC